VRRPDHRGPTFRPAREVDEVTTIDDDLAQAPTPGALATIPTRLMAFAPIVVAVALLALVPWRYHDSGSLMTVVTEGMVLAAYAVAFNIIFGSTGQLFLCVGALAGMGGFASAILADQVGLPLVVSIALAALGAALVGGLLSWVSVKRALDTIFIGIVTLAFSLSFENFVLGRRDLTGGETGIFVEAGSDSFLHERVPPYYLFLALVAVYLVIYRVLQRSRTGWAFRALRDDQLAAELSGVDVAHYRVLAGILGSGMLGLAGALHAHSGRGFIGPTTFGFGDVDVKVLVMLAFGGIGTLLGPIVGAVSITWLDEVLVEYAQLRLVLYGLVIIAMFLRFSRGVVPVAIDLAQRLGGGLRNRLVRPKPPPSCDP
jgi:ABC-type branched-subunit amino acid transport system permease subunit